jgi:hypothetical protein
MKYIALLTLVCSLVSLQGMTQERTASGNLSIETTWNALKILTEQANNSAKIANTTANAALEKATKIEACNKQGKLYAPNTSGVDANDCKAISALPSFSTFRFYGSADFNKAKTVTVESGWHRLCVMASSNHTDNVWLYHIAGPNADGKNRWRLIRGRGDVEPRMLCMD